MGQYGTATGIIRYSDPTSGEGSLLILKDGELLAQFTGDYIRIGEAAGEHVYIDTSSVQIKVGSTTYVNITAGGATFTGEIVATSGSFGGWSVNTSYLAKDTGVDATSAGMAPLDYPFYAGATYANRATAPFRVTPAGALVATSASITGTVVSTSGTIGGFTIGATELYAGSGATRVEMQSSGGFWAGATAFADAPFSVSVAGALKATSGTIGDWTIASAYLAKDTGTDATSAGLAPSDYPFYAGATYANRASAPWRVTPAGTMYIVGPINVSDAAGKNVVIGASWTAVPTGEHTVALGVKAGSGSTGADAIVIGFQAGLDSTGNDLIAIGTNAGYSNSGNDAITIGVLSGLSNTASRLVAIGTRAGFGNTGADVVALGANAGDGNTFADVIVIGSGAVATATNQMVIGSSDHEYNELYGGGGVSQATPPAFRINATGGSGTNVAGAALKLAGGMGTGTGAGGAVTIQTAPVGASSSTPNALVDRLTVDTAGNTKIGDGGTTNYAQFDATGNLTFAGTAQAWDDIRIEPMARTTGSNAPTFEKWYDDAAGTSRGVYLYSFDDAAAGSEKEVFFTLQMSHSWNSGDVHLHIHWIGAVADTTATPRWGLEYCWKEPGAVFGDTTIIYAVGNEQGDTDITAHKHYITEFTALTPGTTADGLSSVLIGRLFRNSSDAADTYNAGGAKVGLLYIDAHYQIARIGSTDEYTA